MTQTVECTPDQARDILKGAGESVISCIFRKRTGEREVRKMICKLAVKKEGSGVGMSYDPEKYDLLSVYDIRKGMFRMINLRTLMQFEYNGVLYIVQHPEKT